MGETVESQGQTLWMTPPRTPYCGHIPAATSYSEGNAERAIRPCRQTKIRLLQYRLGETPLAVR